ncbi:hypothetical protein O181_120090 [Austropuccinia psidii MF-1]|uniref:Uncharacterized protein n=1 Tax=Austropuccinia psidii MF-1 TaxID=1389203 RepID=A0A9Q3KJI7_9BASI|nr:hypothetical protein [Austropuccinia psidii MF-1]
MPIQHSRPARRTRSQARTQAVLTPSPRAPLDGTPAVSQLRAKLDRGPILEGAAQSRKEGRGPRSSSLFSGVVGGFPGTSWTILKGPGEDGEEEEENSVEEEGSDGTEGVPAPVGASQGTGGPTLAHSSQPVSHHSEPSVTTMAIHLLGSPYGISSHSSFMANWPYPSPVANIATSSSYGPFMAICVLGPSWPFTTIQNP